MNYTLSKVLIFAAGGAIGSLVTWKLVKDRYAKIANDEIREMREYFYNKADYVTDNDAPAEVEVSVKPEDIREYANKLSESGYVDYSDASNNKEIEEVKDVFGPYVIAPEVFDTEDEYEIISLTYYADGVLADDMDEVIEDVDKLIGRGTLSHFGEYEDDSIFVRDDERKCDYEILCDSRKYSEVIQ